MEVSTYILFVLGCLGAADIVLFHSVAHGIRSHPDSSAELVTHSLRGPTYAALFVLIPNFAMQGWFAWGMLLLFVFDLAISIWDFLLEKQSRKFLGGLPSGEYVLHMLMAMVFGGLVVSFVSASQFNAPSRLIYSPATVPSILRILMLLMAVLVLASGLQDAAAAWRLKAVTARSRRKAPDIHQVGEVKHGLRQTAGANPSPTIKRPTVWMPAVLVTAGIYNLLWGAWVVMFPGSVFQWAGAPPINYLQVWQCLGMVIGVYGIGYLIASRDPVGHWPIVCVGLLGKVLGPIGMLWSVAHRELASNLAWLCLPNDLIWWLPFALILRAAWLSQRNNVFRRWPTAEIPTSQ